MVERIVSAEVLQQRADTIIIGMRRAVDNGMDPQSFRYLEEEPYSRKHRDLVQVYLGIKPCATHLLEVLDYYDIDGLSPRDDTRYLNHFPKTKDTGVTVLVDSLSCSIWNPPLVEEVLDEHRDLKAMVPVSPSDWLAFGNLLESFYSCTTDADVLLHGVMLGYPRSAVEMFTKYYGVAVDDGQQIWKLAEAKGIIPQAPEPTSVLFDLHGMFGIHEPLIRDEFVRLAVLAGYPKADVVNYIQGLRAADIPGWQFFTSGNVTLAEEKRTRDQFAASWFDDKYTRFLNTLGV